jgi:hypothetical protein
VKNTKTMMISLHNIRVKKAQEKITSSETERWVKKHDEKRKKETLK